LATVHTVIGRKALLVLPQDPAYVVDTGDIGPSPQERPFERQLHGLLAATNDQVLRALISQVFRFTENHVRALQVELRSFLVPHSVITSPGTKSGLRSQ
jgi:hypothetical protein